MPMMSACKRLNRAIIHQGVPLDTMGECPQDSQGIYFCILLQYNEEHTHIFSWVTFFCLAEGKEASMMHKFITSEKCCVHQPASWRLECL